MMLGWVWKPNFFFRTKGFFVMDDVDIGDAASQFGQPAVLKWMWGDAQLLNLPGMGLLARANPQATWNRFHPHHSVLFLDDYFMVTCCTYVCVCAS